MKASGGWLEPSKWWAAERSVLQTAARQPVPGDSQQQASLSLEAKLQVLAELLVLLVLEHPCFGLEVEMQVLARLSVHMASL